MSEQETARDFETEARREGWAPKEEWHGDPEKWIDAETYVKRGESILPIVNAKLRKERERTEELAKTVAELKEGNAAFLQFHEQTLEKAKKERETLIAELEAERKKAITEGDGEAFDRADKQLQEARRTPVDQPKVNPEIAAWKAENEWYEKDAALTAIADALSNVLARENPTLKGKAFLDKLTERVKQEVPHKFQNQRREQQITEDNTRKTAKKGRGFDDLPADAQAACMKFVKTIPGYTKEKYLSAYDWE